MPVRANIRVHTTGALFSPTRSSALMRHAMDDIEEQVAEYAYDRVMDRLDAVLQHPTGYYQSRVRVHQAGSRWQVDDDNVVYGPWLETGQHPNETRFKGYQTFRTVADHVEREAGLIADRILHGDLRGM